MKTGQDGLTANGRKRPVHGIGTVRDLDAANARDSETWIKGEPLLPQIDFEIGVKIHRCARINVADVRQMSGHVARGQIEGAAQRNRRMGKIAADTVTPFDDFGGGEVGPAGTKAVFNIVVDPVT